jgi:hypothetical protein
MHLLQEHIVVTEEAINGFVGGSDIREHIILDFRRRCWAQGWSIPGAVRMARMAECIERDTAMNQRTFYVTAMGERRR